MIRYRSGQTGVDEGLRSAQHSAEQRLRHAVSRLGQCKRLHQHPGICRVDLSSGKSFAIEPHTGLLRRRGLGTPGAQRSGRQERAQQQVQCRTGRALPQQELGSRQVVGSLSCERVNRMWRRFCLGR